MAPGEASVLDAHYGRPRPNTPARNVTPRTAAERAFWALGPVAELWLCSAAASGNTRLGPELAELAALQAAHGPDTLVAALERAITFGRWRASGVRSILAAGTGLPQPTAPGEALVIELPATASRSLAAYRRDRGAPRLGDGAPHRGSAASPVQVPRQGGNAAVSAGA